MLTEDFLPLTSSPYYAAGKSYYRQQSQSIGNVSRMSIVKHLPWQLSGWLDWLPLDELLLGAAFRARFKYFHNSTQLNLTAFFVLLFFHISCTQLLPICIADFKIIIDR